MNEILKGFKDALLMIVSFDRELYGIVFASLRFSLTATLLAATAGLPLGFLIGTREFPRKRLVQTILNTLMALPTVVVGLLIYILISRRGPLGSLSILFTPTAVICGETILSLPIITALTAAAVQGVDPRVRITALTLGAGPWRTAMAILSEARYAVLAGLVAGFGRAVSEIGSALMLGGNIRGYTRTMTTAIALEVSKGEFGLGLALGFFLLSAAFTVNIFFHYLQVKET